MNTQRDEGDGGILLGDNTGEGAVKLWPIWFRCVELCVSNCVFQIVCFKWTPLLTPKNKKNFRTGADKELKVCE